MSWDKFVFVTDLHGDMQDKTAVRVFLEWLKDWQPKHKIFGGDLWDFRAMRHGASQEDKAETMQPDFDAGMMFLKEFKPDVLMRGNHDERLWDFAKHKDGVVGDYSKTAVRQIEDHCRDKNINMLPWHKRHGIHKLGHLKMLHGIHFGMYAAKQHALLYGACLFGHTHSISSYAIPGLERRVGRDVGCLCLLDHEYNRATPASLRHAHGWAYGIVNSKTGNYKVWQTEKVNGEFIFTTDYEVAS